VIGGFAARYDGWCSECNERIEAGDIIGYVDDVVVCEECYERTWEGRRPPAAEPFSLGE
jgi:hypothetical protein